MTLTAPARRKPLMAAIALAVSLGASAVQAQTPKKKPGTPAAAALKTKHVVLVVLGGGVRARDVVGQVDDCKHINRIIQEGLVVPVVKTKDVGHFGSTLTLLTGIQQNAVKNDDRTGDPTIFELLRKNKKLPPEQVWLSAAGSDWHSHLSFSNHGTHGTRFGANYIAGDGVFTSELADVTNQFGEPKAPGETEKSLLDQLHGRIDGSVAKDTASLRPGAKPADVQDRIRRYVLDELSGAVRKIESPGLRDIMAIHYGTNLLAVYKPRLLAICLIYADLGHANRDRYHQVLRKNDAEIGRLWDTIQKDPELKASTSLIIVPEFGRNSRENNKGGLDHDDNGKDHTDVFLVAAGPDFRKGNMKGTTMDATDVAPTVLHLLGVPWQPAPLRPAGKVRVELLNP